MIGGQALHGRKEKFCSERRLAELGQMLNQVEYVLRQIWQSFVDDRFDLGNAIQTKAEFPSAIAVMDKIGGWEEKTWVGSRFVDIHVNSDLQRPKTTYAGLQAATIQIHRCIVQ